MTSAMSALLAARDLWDRQNDQLSILDALTEREELLPGVAATASTARPLCPAEVKPVRGSRSVSASDQVSPPVGVVTLQSLGAGHDTGGEQATGQGTIHVRMRGVPALAPQGHAGTSLAGTAFAHTNSPSAQSPGRCSALRGSQEAC